MKVNLKPTSGYLLIEPLEKEVKTSSGIYLPETTGEKPQMGKVIAVGSAEVCDCKDGSCKKESPAKVGETVLYKKWGGNEVKIENKEYLFVKFDDVLAVEA
ncbi:MAG: co-chaperone GroES [bacterium]|nr:MAG: co-chaperone GroES [bacterium]